MTGLDAHSDSTGLTAEEHGQLGGKPLVVRNETLPNDENLPAEFPEPFQVAPVTSQRALELLSPERHVLRRHGASPASSMAMPETPMNQDDLVSTGKNEIGLSRQVGSVKPVSVAEPGQDGANHLLRLGIARPDPLHSTGGCLVRDVEPVSRHARILLRFFYPIHSVASVSSVIAWDGLRKMARVGDQL